jgi:hypothetical protein
LLHNRISLVSRVSSASEVTKIDIIRHELVRKQSENRAGEISDNQVTGVHKDDLQGLQDKRADKISDDTIKKVEKQVLERISTLTTEMLPKYSRRFYDEGEQKKTADVAGAVEDFISHWAFFRGKLEKKEMDEIVDYVQQQTGVDLTIDGLKLIQSGLITTARYR